MCVSRRGTYPRKPLSKIKWPTYWYIKRVWSNITPYFFTEPDAIKQQKLTSDVYDKLSYWVCLMIPGLSKDIQCHI